MLVPVSHFADYACISHSQFVLVQTKGFVDQHAGEGTLSMILSCSVFIRFRNRKKVGSVLASLIPKIIDTSQRKKPFEMYAIVSEVVETLQFSIVHLGGH